MTLVMLPEVATRPAGVRDERMLRSLFADTRDDLFLLDPDVRDALLDMQYRAQREQVRAAYPDAERLVLLVDGIGVGLLVLDHTTDGVEVVELTVSSSRRGRGIATSALRGVQSAHRSVRIVCGSQSVRGLGSRLGLPVAS